MSEIKSLIWAQGKDANIKEPIEALKEQGWRYGDIPTASNFNWLFKMLTEDLASLKKEVSSQREEFTKVLMAQKEKLEADLSLGINKLDTKFTKITNTNTRACQFNEGISRQICMMLREMEKILQHYHPGFPPLPWPLNLKKLAVAEETTLGELDGLQE